MKSKDSDITFAKALRVERSSRGYVGIDIKGTDIYVIKVMDPALKTQIEQMPYEEHFKPWQEAMNQLEQEAREEARSIYKKGREVNDADS